MKPHKQNWKNYIASLPLYRWHVSGTEEGTGKATNEIVEARDTHHAHTVVDMLRCEAGKPYMFNKRATRTDDPIVGDMGGGK